MSKKHWYNNGVVQRKFKEGEPIPEGWVKGQRPYSEEQKILIHERKKKTNLERYGVEHAAELVEFQNKAKQTSLEKYGKEYYTQTSDYKEKTKQTCLDKYGVDSPNKADIVKKHKEDSMLEKYGVSHALQVDEFLNKQKQTMLERHGVEYAQQSHVIQEKSQQTTLKHYGVKNPAQAPEVQERMRKTWNENYGTDYAFQADEVKVKIKDTNLERYGVENPTQNPDIHKKSQNTLMSHYGVDVPLKSGAILNKTMETNMKKHGVPFSCMIGQGWEKSVNSKPNLMFAGLLDENNVVYSREYTLDRYSYDFKVGNTLIEINPSATHNSLWGPFGGEAKESTYHQKKSEVAFQNGFQCIHIFDWDDTNKIIREVLQEKPRIYARNTSVYGIPKDEVRAFEEEHHLQGYCNGQTICLGLRTKTGELVSLMTFGKPRYNKNYEYELLRYCSSYNIVGGAEKLFSYFLKTYNPSSVISYCDKSKFTGKVYEKLNFVLKDKGKPSCHWYSNKHFEKLNHITDNMLRKYGYDQLFNESYGKGTSNEELIIQRGYLPVYDCGQSTYIYIKGE